MKKIFTLLYLLTVLSAACVGQTVIDGMYYNLNDQNLTAELVPREGTWKGSVELPWKLSANNTIYTLTRIGDYAFYNSGNLNKIYIPSSVLSIGEYAFGSCTGLTDIYIQMYDTTISVISTQTNTFFSVTISNIYLHVPKDI